jgi:hypothetical protein
MVGTIISKKSSFSITELKNYLEIKAKIEGEKTSNVDNGRPRIGFK